MKKRSFIVFEGIDGSGKGTCISHLEAELKKKGLEVLTTAEPSSSDLGKLIRSQIKGSFPSEMGETFGKYTALLMCADRWEHYQRVIRPAVEAGKVVLCDRYVWSTLAYQDGVYSPHVFYEINSLPSPDLTIFLRLPVEKALERIKESRENLDVFESRERLLRVSKAYESAMMLSLSKGEQVRTLDAGLAEEDVARNAWMFVRNFLELAY